jgi:hypothetical protein
MIEPMAAETATPETESGAEITSEMTPETESGAEITSEMTPETETGAGATSETTPETETGVEVVEIKAERETGEAQEMDPIIETET